MFAIVEYKMDPVGFRVLKVFTREEDAVVERLHIIREVVAKANAARQAQFDRGEACRSRVRDSEFNMHYRIQEVD